MIRVEEVGSSRSGMQDFIDLPYRLYRNVPQWVPPLRSQQKKFFSRQNPFLRQGEAAFWVAYQGNRAVARVTSHADPAYDTAHNTRQGFFGFFETEPGSEAAGPLMAAAEQWLRERQVESILGPFNFTASHGIGFLTAGFDRPPTVFMPYTLPEYPEILQALGYRPEKRLVCYGKDDLGDIPERMTQLIDRLSRRLGDDLNLVTFDNQGFEEGFKTIGGLYNEAWSSNWGFAPVTEEEMQFFANETRSFSEKEGVYIVSWKGEPAAFLLAVPDIHEALIAVPDGRLLPFGWWRFLQARKKVRTVVLHALGVKSKFRNKGLDLLFLYRLMQVHPEYPHMKRLETTWILEDNFPLRRILDAFGAEVVKQFVVLKKECS
jgi:hypothetical protein